MNRTIPIAMSLALMTSYAWAEDKEGASSQQQDQAQSQSDSAARADTAASSQDQAGTSSDASATASEDAAQPAAGRQAGQQDPTQMFITDMYSHNLYEIQLGQLAQKQAQDEQVKRFAQMLIEDHTKANQQLKQLAQSAQVQVQEKLDPVHQAKLQKKQQLPQTEFTRKFINDQVGGHTVAMLELMYQSKNAKNPQVKQWAAQQLPKMEQHLKQATEIAMAQVGGGGGQAQPASERQPGQPSDEQGTSGQDAAGQSDKDAAGSSGQDAGQSGQDAAGQSDSSSGQSK